MTTRRKFLTSAVGLAALASARAADDDLTIAGTPITVTPKTTLSALEFSWNLGATAVSEAMVTIRHQGTKQGSNQVPFTEFVAMCKSGRKRKTGETDQQINTWWTDVETRLSQMVRAAINTTRNPEEQQIEP